MTTQLHKNLTGADAIHQATFNQATDPGSVGANLLWIDTSTSPPTFKLRNSGNTAWIVFATGPTGPTGPTGSTGATGLPGTNGNNGINGTNIVSGAAPYINIQDQKTSSTAGGTFTSGADQTRTLNTIAIDTAGLASLASNQFTLAAGTYRIAARAPAALTNRHQAWLQNVSDGVVALRGSSSYASNTGGVQSDSVIVGRISIASAKTFEIRHRAETTSATNGFGVPGSFGTEIYASIEIWLEGGPPPFFGSTQLTAPQQRPVGRGRPDHQQSSLTTLPV